MSELSKAANSGDDLKQYETVGYPDEDLSVLGTCPHGVDLDRDFCPEGCRV